MLVHYSNSFPKVWFVNIKISETTTLFNMQAWRFGPESSRQTLVSPIFWFGLVPSVAACFRTCIGGEIDESANLDMEPETLEMCLLGVLERPFCSRLADFKVYLGWALNHPYYWTIEPLGKPNPPLNWATSQSSKPNPANNSYISSTHVQIPQLWKMHLE